VLTPRAQAEQTLAQAAQAIEAFRQVAELGPHVTASLGINSVK